MCGSRWLALLLAGALAPASFAQDAKPHEHGATASRNAAPIPARVDVPLDEAARAGIDREAVRASAHGQTLDCNGIALIALLRKSGAMPAEPLRGAQLARRVEVRARDGYAVTFGLAELDPTLGNRRVMLVDQCGGRPLDAEAGPLRLIVPDDARPARGIRQIDRISVLAP